MNAPQKKPELLAPAGDWDCLRAAIENGADAVYFGLDCGFNARARATNFSPDDLPKVIETLHRQGVRGYVTLNTLVFPAELEQAESLVRQIAAAGVDAVLVQDLGLVRLIRTVSPDLPIHASTQMTLTSAECIAAARSLGIDRVVLPRELSVDEIGQIHANSDMPLETFVHGALCVAYSGQCLTSESLGGRSANRGQCAQACRLPYELICDGRDVDLGQVQYLLSPQDLAAFALVPDLLAAGVTSLKIEGRLKSAEYVANITRHYRQALAAVEQGRAVKFSPQQIEEMELSFSRGFSPGWLGGSDHKMLVPGLSSAKRGVRLGQVLATRSRRVQVRLTATVARGDGLVFEGDRANNDEQGGRVYEVWQHGRPIDSAAAGELVDLAFGRDAIDFGRIHAGQAIWKTDDPKLTARLKKTFNAADASRRVPLDVQVEAVVGRPLRVQAIAANGPRAEVHSAEPLAVAVKHPLTAEVLREQFGRLGGTVFELRELTACIDGSPMAPLSVLGQVRRELIQRLAAEPVRRAWTIIDEPALPRLRGAFAHEKNETEGTAGTPGTHPSDASSKSPSSSPPNAPPNAPPRLHVLCRSLPQLSAVIETDTAEIIADFQDIREFRTAVSLAHAAGRRILLATPRIQKPGEHGIFSAMLRHGADGFLARNLAGLAFFRQHELPVVADFSLNAANELTVEFLRQQGAARVTPAYDLNRDQLLEVVTATPPTWLEIVIHQHMPLFHMEHCVFCAVLSPGTNKTNCGRPCDTHLVQLRDRIGQEHPLKADVGCRNTLFNAVPQSAAEVVPVLLTRGIRDFRIELLDHSPDETREVIDVYRDLLAWRIGGGLVWKKLKALNRVGITRGTLEERRNPLAIL